MVESLPVVLMVGTAMGFLTGLGIGGGSLLILWLTMVAGLEPDTARAINLLFFLPSAIIACFFRWRQGLIPWKRIFPAILAGTVSAALFSWLGTGLDVDLLKKLFGGLLIITGLREILYKEKGSP